MTKQKQIIKKTYADVKNQYEVAKTKCKGFGYRIFYNHPENTLKKGDIYFLGLNPGGGRDQEKDELTDEDIFCGHGYNYCAYLDEVWGNYQDKGKSPLQNELKRCLRRFQKS